MTYRVEIKDIYKHFAKANDALVKDLGGIEHISRASTVSTPDLIERNWKARYNIDIIKINNDGWKYLDFQSEKHYTAFLLKWSNN